MCYAYKPVYGHDGKIFKIALKEFNYLLREGSVLEKPDGYHYAKDNVGTLLYRNGEVSAVAMRWDLIPKDFLWSEKLSLAETVKKKNSRAKNPVTGKSWGFSSFNARVETVASLWSFRRPWDMGQRCVMPVTAFKERPNMDEAPPDFKGKEYEITLNRSRYLGGIYDEWQSHEGEKIESCTVITLSSEGNEKLAAIWHERIPLILEEEQVEAWLDPNTTPKQAMQMCVRLEATKMEIAPVESK